MKESCSICSNSMYNQTGYMCDKCWNDSTLDLLCGLCATEHNIESGHIIEKVK